MYGLCIPGRVLKDQSQGSRKFRVGFCESYIALKGVGYVCDVVQNSQNFPIGILRV